MQLILYYYAVSFDVFSLEVDPACKHESFALVPGSV